MRVLPTAALAAALVVGLAAAPRAQAATLTVSPLAGTPDASPQTQISLLGVPRSAVRDVIVEGSRSGRHRGRLVAYAAAAGASFLPARPFAAGESVHVRVGWSDGHTRRTRSLEFRVARTAPFPGLAATARSVDRDSAHFVSAPALHPPRISIAGAAPGGDVFLAPLMATGRRPPMDGRYGPMIVDGHGRLIWAHPVPRGDVAMDFRPQRLGRREVLTWWQGRLSNLGFGVGQDEIMDGAYGRPRAIHAGNGYRADLHEFLLGRSGTAWVTAYAPVHANLERLGGRSRAVLTDSLVQEIDLRTGLVMFEWHALGHIPLSESYSRPTRHGYAWDAYHLNSIDRDAAGNLLLSVRNTWALYTVDGRTGAITARIGGKRSNYQMQSGSRFAWQHDAHFIAGGVSVFDNEATPPEGPQSRALVLGVDRARHVVALEHAFTHPSPLRAATQGNVQLLPGGNVFVGWGAAQGASEFDSSGRLLLDVRFPGPDETYRAFLFAWTATPGSRPAVALRMAGRGRLAVFSSWNGATTVARWEVLGGRTRRRLRVLASAVSSGFETKQIVSTALPYIAVRALDSAGHVLRSSAAAKR